MPNSTGEVPVRRSRSVGWAVAATGSVLIAAYAWSYLVRGDAAFPPNLAASFHMHRGAIFTHAFGGSVALLTGAFQHNRHTLRRSRPWHRRVGYVYLAGVVMTGLSGLLLAPFAFGGWVTHAGFGGLAVFLLVTTSMAFGRIRHGDVVGHRAWMLRSFVLIFAAVTLRIELPLLVAGFDGDFTPAYRIVSWLCWVPNLIWGEWWLARRPGRDVVREIIASATVA